MQDAPAVALKLVGKPELEEVSMERVRSRLDLCRARFGCEGYLLELVSQERHYAQNPNEGGA